MQLPDGRMVFVNEGMINLYNGATFSYLHLHENLSYALPGYIGHHRLYSENPERLWMKRFGQLMLINVAKERNEANLNDMFRSMGVKSPLRDFFMDADHRLWLITASGGVYLKEAGAATATFFSELRRISVRDPITDISSDGRTVFFFLASGQVRAYNIDTKKEVYRGNSLEGQREADYRGTTYVIKGDKRLYLLRNGNRGILMSFDVNARTWKRVLETPYTLNTLSIGPRGKVVISVKSGIWSMNADFSDLTYYPTLQLADGRKLHTEISTATYDNQGGLWLGTLNKGLLYHHPKSYRLTEINRARFPSTETKELNVTSFSGLPSSKDIIVGTSHGVFVYRPGPGSIHRWPAVPANVNCLSILQDARGTTWLSTDEGLFRYANGQCEKKSKRVWKKLVGDTRGRYFGMDARNLLFRVDPDADQATPAMLALDGNTLQASASDMVIRGDTLYGINTAGIFRYHLPSGKILFTSFYKNRAFRQLNNYHFSSIAVDSEQRLWIGTHDGLTIWNLKTNTLTELHTEDGMVNNDVKAIIFDNRDDAWVTTAYGISKVKIEATKAGKIRFTNFTRPDGVIAEQFNERACFKLGNGQLVLGGIDGFNLLDPYPYGTDRLPKPIFTDLNVQGTSIRPGVTYESREILDRSITAGGKVTLTYRQNFFTVQFSGLNYANPTRTVYRYTLSGANDTWHEIEPANGLGTATYTHLDPGTYRLQVQASGDGTRWSTTSSLDIGITAPWWATYPMIVLYWVVGLALAGGTVIYFDRRRKAKEQLLQEKRLNEVKFEFFTNVSHELRTPLTLILTPLEIILKRLDNPQLKSQLQDIYHHATHLLSMVNQLLDFRRLQTDEQHLQLTKCNLAESVRLLSDPFKELAQSKAIQLQVHTPAALWLHLDTEKLRIIINNLLSNALKFTPEGGRATLEVSHGKFPDSEKEAAMIVIRDSGKGIAAADIPHIFTRFFQGSNHRPGEMKGSGIGLNLVREYVALHGGEVHVTSMLGEGTTFSVFLPLHPSVTSITVHTEMPPVDAKPGLQTAQILVVEDNEELRRLIAGQFRQHYRVIETGNGKEALARITAEVPDLVISDLMMPEMDGLELCSAIKSNIHTSHLPVILLTAKGSEHAHLEGYRVHADAYITKPFSMELLLQQVKNLLEIQEKRKAYFKNSIVIPLHLAAASEADEKFIAKLLACIEQNLANGDYSVENLSADLYMERSGLYRKVVAITGQVPSLFIRTIRLKKAAQLLLLRQHTVAAVAEMTGFSSPAYFSKCFQDEFGVKPSEYYTRQSSTVT